MVFTDIDKKIPVLMFTAAALFAGFSQLKTSAAFGAAGILAIVYVLWKARRDG